MIEEDTETVTTETTTEMTEDTDTTEMILLAAVDQDTLTERTATATETRESPHTQVDRVVDNDGYLYIHDRQVTWLHHQPQAI